MEVNVSQFINEEKKTQIVEKLNFLFGVEKTENIYSKLVKLVDNFNNNQKQAGNKKLWLDEKDVFLITYGDSIKEDGKPTLQSLHEFLKENFRTHTLSS